MIYLDNAATTQVDEEVLNEMMPYLNDKYGNPGAVYSIGREAADAISLARERVAKVFSCEPSNIIFTSGGSEGNNMVINGLRSYLSMINRKIMVSSEVEHDSVLGALKRLQLFDGFLIDLLKVNSECVVNPHDLEIKLPKNNIGLVSVMYVNNETGAANPIEDFGSICNLNHVLFHTDCVQAAGMIDLNVKKMNCDFATISSHKINGPKGVGAVYAGLNMNKLVPIISGGSVQEYGYRGGTENVAGIVGFGKACELMLDRFEDNKVKVNELFSYITFLIHDLIPDARINGSSTGKIVSVTVPGIDTQSLIIALSDDVAVSAGSACSAHNNSPSHVLKAIGLSDEDAFSTFRISISPYLDRDSVYEAINIIKERINALKTFH